MYFFNFSIQNSVLSLNSHNALIPIKILLVKIIHYLLWSAEFCQNTQSIETQKRKEFKVAGSSNRKQSRPINKRIWTFKVNNIGRKKSGAHWSLFRSQRLFLVAHGGRQIPQQQSSKPVDGLLLFSGVFVWPWPLLRVDGRQEISSRYSWSHTGVEYKLRRLSLSLTI